MIQLMQRSRKLGVESMHDAWGLQAESYLWLGLGLWQVLMLAGISLGCAFSLCTRSRHKSALPEDCGWALIHQSVMLVLLQQVYMQCSSHLMTRQS